jgi:hypothetical protein
MFCSSETHLLAAIRLFVNTDLLSALCSYRPIIKKNASSTPVLLSAAAVSHTVNITTRKCPERSAHKLHLLTQSDLQYHINVTGQIALEGSTRLGEVR